MSISGSPSTVLPTLVEIVEHLAADPSVRCFHIGRSVNTAQACSRKRCRDWIEIYRTRGHANAMIVEDTLLKIFSEHPKLRPGATDSRGGVARERVTNFVYVVRG